MEKKAAAFHEAGHAIVGLQLGLELVSVKITEDKGDWSGITHMEGNPKPQERAVYHAAGPVAEQKGTGTADYFALQADQPVIKKIAGQMLGIDSALGAFLPREDQRKLEEWSKGAEKAAEVLIENDWPKITTLAGLLMEEESVNNDRFSEVFIDINEPDEE